MNDSTDTQRPDTVQAAHRLLLTLVSELADLVETGLLGDHPPDRFGWMAGAMLTQTLVERPTRRTVNPM